MGRGGTGDDVGDGGGVEPVLHDGLEVEQGATETAATDGAAFAGAGLGAGIFAAGDGLEGAVDEFDDLAEGDVGGGSLHLVAAADAAFAAEDAAVFEGEEDLFEELKGDVLLGGEIVNGESATGGLTTHGGEGAEGIFGLLREFHCRFT